MRTYRRVLLDQPTLWRRRPRYGLLRLHQSPQTIHRHDGPRQAEADRLSRSLLPHLRHRVSPTRTPMGRVRVSLVGQPGLGVSFGLRAHHLLFHRHSGVAEGWSNDAAANLAAEDGWRLCAVFRLPRHGHLHAHLREFQETSVNATRRARLLTAHSTSPSTSKVSRAYPPSRQESGAYPTSSASPSPRSPLAPSSPSSAPTIRRCGSGRSSSPSAAASSPRCKSTRAKATGSGIRSSRAQAPARACRSPSSRCRWC